MHYNLVFQAIILTVPTSVTVGTGTPFNATVSHDPFPPWHHNADDIQFEDLIVVPEEARVNPIGVYRLIDFLNFFDNQPSLAGVTINGVMPQSKPN